MVFKRHYEPEIMDDFSITDGRVDIALKELIVINRFLGGNRISRQSIKVLHEKKNINNFLILDVGAGGSDFFFNLNLVNKNIHWTSIDLNIQACRFAKRMNYGNRIVCCNALELPFKDKAFDVVHASLFLHHFNEDDIINLLNAFRNVSKSGIIINDLRRNIIAYIGIKLLTTIFSRSGMVKNDGPLSVKRGFVKKELKVLLNRAGFNNYIMKRKWAFRWMVIIPI